MNITLAFATISRWIQQFARQRREARRLRRDLEELSRLDAHSLRDIGMSHAAAASADAIRLQSLCA